jgi:hypothetical protein
MQRSVTAGLPVNTPVLLLVATLRSRAASRATPPTQTPLLLVAWAAVKPRSNLASTAAAAEEEEEECDLTTSSV